MTLRNLSDDMPSVTFNFEGAKKLDGRITFTRASYADNLGNATDKPNAGTGTSGGEVQSFNINVPRLTDQGLLIEESRTNILLHSKDFSSTWDISSYGTANTNTTETTAPDKSNTALKFTGDTTDGQVNSSGIIQSFTEISSGTALAATVYAKAGSSISVLFRVARTNSSQSWINFSFTSNTVIGSNLTPAEYSTEYAGNGWYRLCIKVKVKDDINKISIVPNDSQSVYLWGAQLETGGAFPTSYIPTSGTTVTRASDLCEITGDNFSNWFNNNQGEGSIVASAFDIYNGDLFEFTAGGSFSNRIVNSGSSTALLIQSSGTGGTTRQFSFVTPTNENYKLAGAWQVNNLGFAFNGVGWPPITSAKLPVGMNQLNIGKNFQDRIGNINCGYIHHLIYYPTRLPDSALGGLTQ